MKLSVFFVSLQITMPKCHEVYPNCIWHVPLEWFSLSFNSTLLTKVYWNYAIHIISVCGSPLDPINLQLNVSKRNLQVHFGSKAKATLYELLCDQSLMNTDPLLEELLFYLPTRFPSHIFEYIAYGDSDHESVDSIDSYVSAFCSDGFTYFS